MQKCINTSIVDAYVNNIIVNIDNYIDKFKSLTPKCINGHILIPVIGDKNKHHFRHINAHDIITNTNGMTKWHLDWQSQFTDTEIDFPMLDGQINNRRADIVLKEHNIVVEIQHSQINSNEVLSRKKDYELHNHKTVWIIDGNDNIKITELQHTNRIFIEFTRDIWRYNSFNCYDYIFLNNEDKIYKIYPKYVKNKMIDVEKPVHKSDFITELKSNHCNVHKIDIPTQCNLYLKQQGAGNGKTYNIIQMLESEDFQQYPTLIAVTKQHSAKYMIYNEFKSQIENGNLKYLELESDNLDNNKYTITYKNKNNNNICNLVIATIDSLMYSLGNINNNEINNFEGIVNSIIDGYIIKNKINSINYANINIKLNKNICLICDETQDLSSDYAKAIIKIMRDRYIDAYIVGDKLQSLVYEDNAFTYLCDNEFSYINKKTYEPSNICRRFTDNNLTTFVNNIIDFKKFNLPQINPYCENNIDNSLCVFEGKNVYNNETNEYKINSELKDIMDRYIYEVDKYDRKPNDFLVITPFTKNNPLVSALETAINKYWLDKYNNDDDDNNKFYNNYVIFHKSEEGTSIDLSESIDKTRIVSIHTSKGDGRKVVFVIGLTESSLKKFSGESNNLIYYSLIHVALTRMKEKLYIRVVQNNDDIHRKITQNLDSNNILNQSLNPELFIENTIKYKHIIEHMKSNKIYKELYENIINKSDIYELIDDQDDEHKIIDMGHHNIRYFAMVIYLYMKIINSQYKYSKDEIKKQLVAMFYTISSCKIHIVDKYEEYNNIINKNNNKNIIKKYICVLEFTNHSKDYRQYFNIICNFIKSVKGKINSILSGNISLLCPYECVILYYMMQICSQGIYTDISINDLYKITNIYNNSFDNNLEGHNDCICKEQFIGKSNNANNTKINDMRQYLYNHYENIENIGKVYDKCLHNYPNINWLINHSIKYNGANDMYKITKKFNIIGYSADTVIIIYVKPQVSNLNYNEILVDSIFDTFLLSTLNNNNDDDIEQYDAKIKEDIKRFSKKCIKTIIFSLNKNDYIELEWKSSNSNNTILSNNQLILNKIKEYITGEYNTECNNIYSYYKFVKGSLKITDSNKLITNIINKFNKHKYHDKHPEFVGNLLKDIEYYVKNKKNINDFDDYNTFTNLLLSKIDESVSNYLGFEEIVEIEKVKEVEEM